jgi:hypothetical protein
MSAWQRPDGQSRWLVFLDGPPAALGPESRWERRLDVVDACVPWWDDALILGTVAGLCSALLAAVVG